MTGQKTVDWFAVHSLQTNSHSFNKARFPRVKRRCAAAIHFIIRTIFIKSHASLHTDEIIPTSF